MSGAAGSVAESWSWFVAERVFEPCPTRGAAAVPGARGAASPRAAPCPASIMILGDLGICLTAGLEVAEGYPVVATPGCCSQSFPSPTCPSALARAHASVSLMLAVSLGCPLNEDGGGAGGYPSRGGVPAISAWGAQLPVSHSAGSWGVRRHQKSPRGSRHGDA